MRHLRRGPSRTRPCGPSAPTVRRVGVPLRSPCGSGAPSVPLGEEQYLEWAPRKDRPTSVRTSGLPPDSSVCTVTCSHNGPWIGAQILPCEIVPESSGSASPLQSGACSSASWWKIRSRSPLLRGRGNRGCQHRQPRLRSSGPGMLPIERPAEIGSDAVAVKSACRAAFLPRFRELSQPLGRGAAIQSRTSANPSPVLCLHHGVVSQHDSKPLEPYIVVVATGIPRLNGLHDFHPDARPAQQREPPTGRYWFAAKACGICHLSVIDIPRAHRSCQVSVAQALSLPGGIQSGRVGLHGPVVPHLAPRNHATPSRLGPQSMAPK